MLTYVSATTAPMIGSLARPVRAAAISRHSNWLASGSRVAARRALCERSLGSGLAAASTWSNGGSAAVSGTTRTRLPAVCGARQASLRIEQEDLIYRTSGLSRAVQKRVAATGPVRCLSYTSQPVREKEDEKSQGKSDPKEQKEAKGIQKVIPSLTPHENIYTVPNILTFSRLAISPFIGYAILHDAHHLALGLFAYAGVSDLLDGWIARRWKLQTVVGSVVDPMADKILMTILTVCLATKGALPVWLAAIILGRDVGLGIAAIYYRWISLPPPKTFTRYWDFSLPSAEVRPTTISKYNTFLQLGLMGAMMVAPVLNADVGGAMTALQYLVATTTVWSGLSYVFSKDAVRILTKKDQKKKDS